MSVTVLGTELVWALGMDAHELQKLVYGLYLAGVRQQPMPNVELLLVRDAEMAVYNAQFMNCEGPTNILSFPTDADDHSAPASLLLSVDTLRREAFLYGDTVGRHLLRLLAHGMGHVAGFDHGPAMDQFCANILQSQEKGFSLQKSA